MRRPAGVAAPTAYCFTGRSWALPKRAASRGRRRGPLRNQRRRLEGAVPVDLARAPRFPGGRLARSLRITLQAQLINEMVKLAAAGAVDERGHLGSGEAEVDVRISAVT